MDSVDPLASDLAARPITPKYGSTGRRRRRAGTCDRGYKRMGWKRPIHSTDPPGFEGVGTLTVKT
jgi:hypothetical protein